MTRKTFLSIDWKMKVLQEKKEAICLSPVTKDSI